MRQVLLGALMVTLPAFAEAPKAPLGATAELKNAQGEKVGDATFEETPHGVLITAELAHLPPGVHAFHIHETGKCEPPFKSAGGHLNPGGRKHGIKNMAGKHEGDLPNVTVAADGKATVQVLVGAASLRKEAKNSLFDADGSALVLHEGADDHMSDPAGNAGGRIACGVITQQK